ncbi:uncharacterized protein BT62DRAFT_928143 [Guyanagaster necrorhizus]|uniref:F-box domain-containing protein n=1 Tax=Guyanagaster necrorhizus TaxID=856835 RepID=A0A9P8AWN6_9AGAR|nr:uncharacterized protein BT62DRAFT_928143 [Guyanagaster necrorhizus MCA 3950]KAG7450859.1 hypothetical protein BT62DRAFT_928143 [Guyanagaster necrorhizus MCA 3950]
MPKKSSSPSAPPKPSCLKCGFILSHPQSKREPPHLRLKELLKTNVPPLEAEKAFFRKAKKDLPVVVSDLDEQITQTQELLHTLMEERAQAAEELRHAKVVLHPLRTIPDDVLREIFLFNKVTWDDFVRLGDPRRIDFYDSLDPRNAPWSLTQVCRNWRSVALSMPSLWNCISLDFNVYHRKRDRPASVALKLGLHIQRARRSLLSIRIESMVDIHTHNAFPIILTSMSQWRRLHIRTPIATLHYLTQCKAFLESLEEVYIIGSLFPVATIAHNIETFQMAANLRRLNVFEKAVFHSHHIRVAWSQLTHLSIKIDSDATFHHFKEFKRVEELRLVFPSGPQKLNVSQRITLPKVAYLSLTRFGAMHRVNTVAGLFDMFELPSLLSVTFASTGIEPGLKGMILDLPASLSYPDRRLLSVDVDYPDYDIGIPENNTRFLNFLSQASDVVGIFMALQNIGSDVIKKLSHGPDNDVNSHNFFPRLRTLDFNDSTFTASQIAILDMLESRLESAHADDESYASLMHVTMPEDFEFDEPGTEERCNALEGQGLYLFYLKGTPEEREER